MKEISMSIIMASLLISACVSASPEADDALRAVGLKAASALFVERNMEQVMDLLAENAADPKGIKGAGITWVKRAFEEESKLLASLKLKQVIFFRSADIEDLATTYPSAIWLAMKDDLGESFGCVCQVESAVAIRDEVPPGSVTYVFFILDHVDGHPKIVRIVND